MDPSENPKRYDLEERTFVFAAGVRSFVKRLPRTLANTEDARQLVRASGSVGANYIEANESLGKKDFLMHIKISRKEAKESSFFLRLLDVDRAPELEIESESLVSEAHELTNIFGAIFRRSE
jgi:four helix bundle protein